MSYYRQRAIDNIDKAVAAANSAGQLKHPGFKGRLRELAVVTELIKPFLAPHIKTTSGMIIDRDGCLSNQIDIILYDERVTPPILFSESEGIVPGHAVVATIEVKSCLDKKALREAVDNARSVKARCSFRETPPNEEQRFDRWLDAQILGLLPDTREKQEFERWRRSVNSPACYIFAFQSNMRGKREPRREEQRLREVVEEKNQESERPVYIPITGICIADRTFLYCVGMDENTKVVTFHNEPTSLQQQQSDDKSYRADHRVVLKFISQIVEVCNVFSNQRWRVPLELYFDPLPENNG